MGSLIGAFVLSLVLVQVMQVYCVDLVVRPRWDPVGRPREHLLVFENEWRAEDFRYQDGPLELKCYAVVYYTKKPTTVEIRRTTLSLTRTETIGFYVRPRAFKYGWRIQCDYRYKPSSYKAMKEGIVLHAGPNDWKCLLKHGGCRILFTNGEVRRISKYGGNEFLGELPRTKCILVFFCKERRHSRFLFGNVCPNDCGF